MNPPPRVTGLLLVASLFWGWHANLLIFGLAIGVLLELSARSRWRWEFERSDLYRIADLCTLLLVGAGVYLYATTSLSRLVLGLLEWSPLLFGPLVLAQLLGGLSAIPLSALFYSLRRRGDGGRTLDLYLPFVLLCLLAASVSAERSPEYFIGLALLLFWLMWQLGTLSRYPRSGVLLFLLAVWLGHLGQIGLTRLQAKLEEEVIAWLTELFSPEVNPYLTTTAIGDVGNLKLSDWIRYRVVTDSAYPADTLLRVAAYNFYLDGSWAAGEAVFRDLQPTADGMQWQLATPDANHALQQLTVSATLDDGSAILPLPGGSRHLANLPVGKMERNRLGTLRVSDGPALVDYQVDYLSVASLGGAPTKLDLQIPVRLEATLQEVAATIRQSEGELEQQVAELERYFDTGFGYSLRLQAGPGGVDPITHFLLERRAGHCEYYATATTLLLRQMGIPARYVRGFSLQEYSTLEDAWVIRSRHAHAWSEYWDGRQWRALDNTPSVWVEREEERASFWQPLHDIFAWLGHRFTRLSQGGEENDRSRWLVLLLPLVALLVWRLARQRKGRRNTESDKHWQTHGMAEQTLFVEVEHHLQQEGLPRRPGETLGRWFTRIEREHPGRYGLEQLRPLLDLHYRQRFSLRQPDEIAFKAARVTLNEWLEQVAHKPSV